MSTTTKTTTAYWLPTIPLTPIDLINRRAAATGSMRYAQLAEHGDYNGHRVSVTFKPEAVSGPTWNAEYWWAGRCVIARGTLATCLRAAADEYARGARGTEIIVALAAEAPEPIAEQIDLCRAAGFAPYERPPAGARPHYWTGKHEAVCDALTWANYGFAEMVQHALEFEGSPEEWPATRKRWLDARNARVAAHRAAAQGCDR